MTRYSQKRRDRTVYVDDPALTPWNVVAERTGLSIRQVRRVFNDALRKAREECLRRGLQWDDVAAHIAARDATVIVDLPPALIPDGDVLLADVDDAADGGGDSNG